MVNADQASISHERKLSFTRAKRLVLRPRVIASIVVIGLAIAPLGVRVRSLSRVPFIEEPFAPNPVSDFELHHEENAFTDFNEAHSKFVEFVGEAIELDEAEKTGWTSASGPAKDWVERNQAFMGDWLRGSRKPDAQYKRAGQYEFGEELPLIADSRRFCRLASLHSLRLLAEGKSAEAWDWLLASFRVSRQIGRRGTAYERVAGYWRHAASLDAVARWAHESSVSAELLGEASRDLQSAKNRRGAISECLQVEYSMLSRFIRSPSLYEALSDDEESKLDEWFNRLQLFLRGEPDVSERILRYVFANWLENADKDLSSRPRQIGNLRLFEFSQVSSKFSTLQLYDAIGCAIVAKNLLPPTAGVLSVVDLEILREDLIALVLALEHFARRHTSYPETLDALVPDFIEAVPVDLYSKSKERLRYLVQDDAIYLFSVGLNGKDDGGLFENGEDIGYRIGKPRQVYPK